MIVDAHAHYHPVAYIEALRDIENATVDLPWGPADTDSEEHIQARLEMMADAGVGLQVLSPMAGRAPYSCNEAAAAKAARFINDAAGGAD